MNDLLPAGMLVASLFALTACSGSDASCNLADTRCSGSVVQTCAGDAVWTDTIDCTSFSQVCTEQDGSATCTAEGSDGGTGRDAGTGSDGGSGVCMALDHRCNGNVYERCNALGTAWMADQDCNPAGQMCQTTGRQQCVPQPCTRGTDPEFRCTPSGISQICANQYETYVDCNAAGATCNSETGQCETTASCTDNAQRCQDNRKEVCTGNAWRVVDNCSFTSQTCEVVGGEADCQGAPSCIEGERRCSRTSVEECVGGAYVVQTDCAAQNQECEDAMCVTPGCITGTITCADEVATICKGGMEFMDDCGSRGLICDPLGPPFCASSCTNNTSRCHGNDIENCIEGQYQFSQTCAGRCEMPPRGSPMCVP